MGAAIQYSRAGQRPAGTGNDRALGVRQMSSGVSKVQSRLVLVHGAALACGARTDVLCRGRRCRRCTRAWYACASWLDVPRRALTCLDEQRTKPINGSVFLVHRATGHLHGVEAWWRILAADAVLPVSF